MSTGYLNFNDAEQQQFGDLIPNGTIAPLSLHIRPGGKPSANDPEGWLTQSQTSDALYLNCEFTVLAGPYARRKLWQNMTVAGGKLNDKGQSIGGEITRSTLRAMVESARGILPTDFTDKAMAARRVQSFAELEGLSFIAKIGIEKGKDGYQDKNKISTIITPDKKEYAQAMAGHYPDPAQEPAPQQKPSWATGPAPASVPTQAPTTPSWAAPSSGSPPSPPAQGNKPTVPNWAQ